MSYCINKNFSHSILINKSEFVAHFYKVNTQQEAEELIKTVKIKYTDASHNCYCYIIGSLSKVNDDGEPNGTAGLPILNVLQHHKMDNILCIVTRYFGGIKLGTGGLTRAYSNSVSQALKTIELQKLIPGYVICITFEIAKTNSVDYYLKTNGIEVISKEYRRFVSYQIECEKEEYDAIVENLSKVDYNMKIIIINEIVLTKKI